MVEVRMVTNPDDKYEITRSIMLALPLWFSPPEDIEKKACIHRDYPFFAAFDEGKPIGFAALKIHNPFTADIYNLGVLQDYHRKGIGKDIIKACHDYCKSHGFTYLTVKTLDSSAEYEPYERTRAFYQKMGFIPLEVFPDYWNSENPCLFMVKRVNLK